MATFFKEESRTFNEYLIVPGYSSAENTPDKVDLTTPLVRYKKGETPAISLKLPMISAIMQTAGLGSQGNTALPGEMITAIEECGFFESIPLWAVTLTPTAAAMFTVF